MRSKLSISCSKEKARIIKRFAKKHNLNFSEWATKIILNEIKNEETTEGKDITVIK